MSLKHVAIRMSCLVSAATLVACVGFKQVEQERTVDGLERLPGRQADTVFVAPGSSLARYRRVLLDPVEVAFKKDSAQGAGAVPASERERLRRETAASFRETFTRELQDRGGYTIADVAGADVLRVSPSLVDLAIAGPQGGVYWLDTGEMTLLAELRDSETGAILVRAADRERGRQSGQLRVDDSVGNSAEAREAFSLWAGLLRNALDAAKTPPAR